MSTMMKSRSDEANCAAHRGLDYERLETFLLGTTNKAEIAKQGNL